MRPSDQESVIMSGGIEGHVAVITGGGRGIGAATAQWLARDGAAIAVWDRDEVSAHATAEEIRRLGGRALAVVRGVESPEEVRIGVAEVQSAFGQIDILVNNAGFSHLGPVTEMTDEQWASVVGVHMTGAFNLVRAVAPGMKTRRYGRIVNMSSLASMGADGMACYATVKAGLQGLTRALAVELGPYGITVNAVAPSLIRTARLKASPAFERLSTLSLRGQSIQRDGAPDDVANAISFFASAHSGFVTGEVLFVTGGIRQLW